MSGRLFVCSPLHYKFRGVGVGDEASHPRSNSPNSPGGRDSLIMFYHLHIRSCIEWASDMVSPIAAV